MKGHWKQLTYGFSNYTVWGKTTQAAGQNEKAWNILARTILIRSRFAGLLAVILFFVIDFVVARVYDLICRIPFIATWTKIGALGWSLWDVVYFIAVCLILFGVSGLLAEKKLSV